MIESFTHFVRPSQFELSISFVIRIASTRNVYRLLAVNYKGLQSDIFYVLQASSVF